AELSPLVGIALHARRPAGLLVAEGALAEDLLARRVVGEVRDREREPAVRRQLPGELARVGLALEDQRLADRRRLGELHHVRPIAEARPARAQVVAARLERRHRPAAVAGGVAG